MRNKLQTTVAKTPFFSSKSYKISVQNTTLFTGLIFALFLLFSSTSFAQINENFESGVPATWTLFGNGVGTTNWGQTPDGYLGSNAASVNPSADNIGDQNTAQYFLVTPQFPVPENGEIHFYTKQASELDNGAEYQIRISTALQPDINGFNIVLESYSETTLNIGSQTAYEKKVVELPPSLPEGLDVFIAFVAVNTQEGAASSGDEWFVDDVSILEGCIEIENDDVTIDEITVDGAEVTWVHPTASDFEIQVFPAGGTPAGAGIPVSTTSYTLNGLDEDTEFDVYIRSICDNSTISEWSGPYTFQTLKFGLSCDEPIVIPDISTTPYVLVDNLQNWANPDETYTTQGANCGIVGSPTGNYLNGDKVFLTYTPTQDGLITLTTTTATLPGGGDNDQNCFNDQTSLFVYESCSDVGVNCIAGVNTTDPFTPKSISNLLVLAGQTYVIVLSSELSSGAGICFELEITSPTCAPPSDLVYSNLTENSVSFSWDNIGGFADSWEYAVVPVGSGEPTAAGTPTNTNIDNLINTGLTPATTYDYYVRSVCGGTPGVWSNPETFTTQCTLFDTPYSTDFNNATNQNPEPCWTTIDANGDGNQWGFIGGYATVRSNVSRFENNDLYISPQINFDGTPKRIRYKHRATQGVATYTVKLSTTGVGVDNFTTVVVPETQINNTGFQEVIVDLPDVTGNVNIAWIVEPNTSETALRLSIDDVFIEDKPTCPDPLDPFILNVTTNSAWLFWTPGDEETQWEVSIQAEGSGEPTGSGTLVSSNFPYMATGLEPGTRYEFYVRASCASDDQSGWVGPVAFTTLCESYDSPFYESFDDADADTQKFCWTILDSNNDDTAWVLDDTKAVLQTPPFAPASSYNDYLISPAINIDGIKELKYKYRAQFSFFTGSPRYGLEVLMSTTNNNPGSFSVISPFEVFSNTGYEEKSIIIEGTGTIYIAFRVPPELTGGVSILNIDDVSITDAPACPNPSDLIVDTVLADGADLSWTEGYQETAWNVVVQPEGSGVPTSSGTQVMDTNFSPTGLTPQTNYEFYVQADCGGDTSEWIGPVTFSTLCTAFTAPFVETFNTDSDSENCWQIVNDNGDLETWELNSAAFPYEGDQAAAMFTGTNGQNEDWLISPTITISENQRLRYYYRVFDSFFTEDLEVLLSTNGTGLDQFTTVLYDSDDDPVTINNVEYRVKIIDLPDINGDVNIAFHVPFFPSTLPYRGQTLVIDNVNIEDIPECPQPTNITLDNITDTGVQVGWDVNGSEMEWEISVQPSGTPAPVGDTDPDYLYNASTNPFTVTGLTASSMYDIYVRAVCSGSTEAEWTEPVTVTTQCSFDNLCQYTFVLTSDSSISTSLDLTQNNQVVQSFPFNGQTAEEFPVFLCSGIEFSLFFQTIGSSAPQYANYQFEIRDDQGATIYTSPIGLEPRRTVYEGIATCGTITCPQPTNLSVSETSVFSWIAGGGESQWEVAVQPLENGTIPQSGTLVSTNSYTPTAADFNDLNTATYEYFVRAICGTDDTSYWSGPYEFVRNDDASTALTLPINADEVCNESIKEVSFINATTSQETMTCPSDNAGDIWFNFTAESLIHIFEINNFNGNLREDNGDEPYPDITMTLYKDNGASGLEEMICSYDNLIVAMYASELVVGDNYKLRVTLNGTESNSYKFNVCVKTPTDLCDFDVAVNGGFEEPAIGRLSGVNTIITMQVIPGWSQNLDSSNSVFLWESLNAPGFTPYEGGQFVQILSDQGTTIDPNDPDIKGYYRDFDTSEMTLFDISFAHYARFDGNNIQLYAGEPGGPYTLVTEHLGDAEWQLVTSEYEVPENQDTTRFIFRANGTDNIGNALDAVSFVANNEILTEPFEVDCNNATATVEANGVGTWISDENNPSDVTFTDASSNNPTISGFVQPGVYTFTWKTSYCENTIELTYNGVGDIPTVETPVTYCLNATAEPLSATATGSYTLLWYTQATGGTGTATAPTPDTSVAATTSYYVANVDTNGCEGPRAEIVVEVNDAITPELTFSYDTTCEVATDNPLPVLASGFATGGTFSSTTITVDAVTGEIDMASATAGSHDILYTFDGNPDTCLIADTFTASIEFTAATVPVTTFDYGLDPFCLLAGNSVLPTLGAGFTTGGTYSSTTLTVDGTTGEVDLTSASVGMHDVIYTIEADPVTCLEAGETTATIEVVETIVPETMFTYNEDTYCSDNANVLPVLDTNFATGGNFSAETGLSIDATTGEINISTSTAGSYTVTYSILEDLANCVEASSSTFSLTISDTITPVTMFDYGSTPFCMLNGNTVLPNLATGFTTGGTFSSPTVTVDAATGEIDLTSAIAGTHDIVYTLDADPNTCTLAGTFTTTIEVVQVTSSITEFSYVDDLYCADSPSVLPDLAAGFTTGGVFSAETGLSINANTGEINISASSLGNYTITYEIIEDTGTCTEGSLSMFDITILDSIDVVIDGACDGTDYVLSADPINNSFNPDDVTYTWRDANGNMVGQNSNEFNVTNYADQNNLMLPAQFSVTIEFGSCTSIATFTAERSSCREIPRGISPDGNGKNDAFDLTGYGVTKMEIFNRNGRKVFDYNGVYTNQWYGQSNKGNDLPDGTYFYSILKDDGSQSTGWVFINRAQ